MNRNEKFYLIMAVFYTVLSGIVIYIVFSMRLLSFTGFLLLFLALLCSVGQWLRFRRARDQRLGIVRKKRIPKFVPMPDKAPEAGTENSAKDAPAGEESNGTD